MRLTANPAPQSDDEESLFLASVATELIEALEAVERQMADKLYRSHLDQDEILGVWGMLPAKVRTAINRGNGKK